MKNQKNTTAVNTTAVETTTVNTESVQTTFDFNDPANAIQPVKSATIKPTESAQTTATVKPDKKTAAQLKTLSYNAYKAIVQYEEQLAKGANPSIDDLSKAIASCLRAYGMKDWDQTGTVVMLLQRLVSFGKKDGNTGWKVLGVTTFRKQMTTWAETVEGKGVIYSKNDKNDPSSASEKAKKPTKADLEAQTKADARRIAELEALLAKAKTAETKAA